MAVTIRHGFALNVKTDLEHWQGFVACELEGGDDGEIERSSRTDSADVESDVEGWACIG